jgi:hypothetical protein
MPGEMLGQFGIQAFARRIGDDHLGIGGGSERGAGRAGDDGDPGALLRVERRESKLKTGKRVRIDFVQAQIPGLLQQG